MRKYGLKIIAGFGLIISFLMLFLVLYFRNDNGFQRSFGLFEQNNNNGYFLLTFNNNQSGIGSISSGVILNPIAGTATLSGSNGQITTISIIPNSFSGRKTIEIEGLYNNTGSILTDVLSCSDVVIPGFSGKTLNGGQIDISSIDSSLYDCLKLRVNLIDLGSGVLNPTLYSVRATRNPKPFYITTISAPTVRGGQQTITYTIQYALSYVSDSNVVFYAELPKVVNSTITGYTPSYGQNLNLSVDVIGQGGFYTAGGVVVNGVTIPANSVYWTKNSINPGDSGVFTFRALVPAGVQNGVKYLQNIKVQGQKSSLYSSLYTTTTVQSSPVVDLKHTVLGAIQYNAQNFLYIPYNSVLSFGIDSTVRQGEKNEAVFNGIIKSDLTEIFSILTSSCGVAPINLPSKVSGIFSGGVLSGNFIVRNVGTIPLGILPNYKYNIDFSSCPLMGLDFNSNFSIQGDNLPIMTKSLNIKSLQEIEKGTLDKEPDFDAFYQKNVPETTYFEEPFYFSLLFNNIGLVRYDNLFLFDKIPAGLSVLGVSLEGNSDYQIFYSQTGEFNSSDTPPAYTLGSELSGSLGPNRTTTPSGTDKWIGIYVKCVDSPYFPSPSGSSCYQKASGIVGRIQAKIDTPVNACSGVAISNTGLTEIYAAGTNPADNGDANVASLLPKRTYLNEGYILGLPLKGLVETQNILIKGPVELNVGNQGTYTLDVKNIGKDVMTNSTISVLMTGLLVNGQQQSPLLINAEGDDVTIDYSQIGNGILIFNLGSIGEGELKNISFTIEIPKGIDNGSQLTLLANIAGQDDSCGNITALFSKQISLYANPSLEVFKQRDKSHIFQLGTVNYVMSYFNNGEATSKNTYLIDQIPQGTEFIESYTDGLDYKGQPFNCSNCKVLFANNNSNLPSSLLGGQVFDAQLVRDYFVLGTNNGGGVWSSPFGTNTKYVAYLVDQNNGFGSGFFAGSQGKVGLRVKDISNPQGSIITNSSAIFSNELPQAISNQVETTILEIPGISVSSSPSPDTVTACEEFDWNIPYYNDGSNPNLQTTIAAIIPQELIVLSGYHSWNYVAVTSGGMNTGEISLDGNTNYTYDVANQKIIFDVVSYKSGFLNAGNLEPLEGGILRLRMKTKCTVPSTTLINLNVQGFAQNQFTTNISTDQGLVNVQNADLWLRKLVDQNTPVQGETVTYTLQLSNMGNHSAENISIEDVMPAGVCFTGTVQIISPSGRTIEQPNVIGTCIGGQTLQRSGLKNISYDTGYMPGNFVNPVLITYKGLVSVSLPNGTDLLNGASVVTTTQEDGNYPNTTDRLVRLPNADPTIGFVTTPIVKPGNTLTYSVEIQNLSRACAQDVYTVFSLMDYNLGESDMQITSISSTSGMSLYFHDGNIQDGLPVFDYSDPLTGGWSATYSSGSSFVAVTQGLLCKNNGIKRVYINGLANEKNGTILPAGISLETFGEVFSNGVDENTGNNYATGITKTIGMDLSLDVVADSEGVFPGTKPGKNILYTVTYKNEGSERSCGNYITLKLDSDLVPNSPLLDQTIASIIGLSNPNVLDFTDVSGSVLSAIPLTVETISSSEYKVYFGTQGTYTNVCLPANSQGSFTLQASTQSTTLDSHVLVVTGSISEDGPAVEEYLENNNDVSKVYVYRPDLVVKKSGLSYGINNVLGGGDDTTETVNMGETILYTINYGNIGNTSAENSIISDRVPEGTCYKVGKLESTKPVGTVVEYSTTNGSTRTNSVGVSGTINCNVTDVRVVFNADIIAPSSYDGSFTLADFTSGIGTSSTFATGIGFTSGGSLQILGFPLLNGVNNNVGVIDTTADRYITNDVGDINDDGIDDIVAFRNTSLLLYYGGSGYINDPITLASGFVLGALSLGGDTGAERAHGIRVADINNDGIKEIIIGLRDTGSGSYPRIYYQNNGNFSSSSFVSITGVYGVSISNADFNNDGFQDLVFGPRETATFATGISILYGNGTLTGFSLNSFFPTTDDYNVKVFDVDGDGDEDVVAMGDATQLRVLTNNGGIFTEYIGSAALPGGGLYDYLIDYISGSSYADIIATNRTTVNSVRLQLGSGFGANVVITGGGVPLITRKLFLQDYDGDGDKDLYVGANVAPFLRVFLNSGGNFQTAVTASLSTGGVLGSIFGIDSYNSGLLYLQGSPSILGSFSGGILNIVQYLKYADNSLLNPNAIKSFDYDGDGDLDIIVGGGSNQNINNGLYILKNIGQGPNNMPLITVIDPSLVADSIASINIVDMDNDGKEDIVVSEGAGVCSFFGVNSCINQSNTNQNYVLYNYGSGSFSDKVSLPFGSGWGQSITTHDFNNDGRPDIIKTSYRNSALTGLSILFSAGSGYIPFLVDSGFAGIPMVADMNNDGYMDIVLGSYSADPLITPINPPKGLRIYLNNGSNSFSLSYNSSTYWGNIDIADVDNDGNQDITVSHDGNSTPDARILYGAGDGINFTDQDVFPNSSDSKYTRFIDLNNDGFLDIVGFGANVNTQVLYSLNIGGRFYAGTRQNYNLTNYPSLTTFVGQDSDIIDFDKNGYDDVLIPGAPSNLVLLNSGINYSAGNKVYRTLVEADNQLIAWNKLLVSETIPTGTSITYNIYNSVGNSCSPAVGSVILSGLTTNGQGSIALNTIPSVTRRFCLEIVMSTIDSTKSPQLQNRLASYVSNQLPGFTMEVVVQSGSNIPSTITNIVNIQNDITELRNDNNSSQYDMNLANADLKIEKFVNKSAVSPGESLQYTLNYVNLGPSLSESVVIDDWLPSELTYDNSIAPVVPTLLLSGGFTRLRFTLGNIPVGGTGQIIINATVSGGVLNGTNMTNRGMIASFLTYDPILSNNQSQVASIVGNYANVYTRISCPTTASLGGTLECTMTYGNNGNIIANNVNLNGILDPNVTFVSGDNNDCSFGAGKYDCQGGIFTSINPGFESTVKFTVLVDDNYTLITSGVQLNFVSQISTVTPETTLVDNQDNALVSLVLGGLNVIQGVVYVDKAQNNQYDTGVDQLQFAAQVFLVGKDIFGTVYGPNPSTHPALYSGLVTSQGLTGAKYLVKNFTRTSPQGGYSFGNLNPGLYQVYLNTPLGFQVISSLGGELLGGGKLGSGFLDDLSVAKNDIIGISLNMSQTTINNNYGIISLCGNGIVDSSVGEQCDDGLNNGQPGFCPMTCLLTTLPVVDMGIEKTVNPLVTASGFSVTYTLRYFNTTANQATGVYIEDELPAGVTYVSSSIPRDPLLSSSDQLVFIIGGVPGFGSGSITITALVTTGSVGGTLVNNIATVYPLNSDSNPANNSDDAQFTAYEPYADLSISKSINFLTVTSGTNVTYTLNYFNTGLIDAVNVRVLDYLPNGFNVTSSTPSGTIQNVKSYGTVGDICYDDFSNETGSYYAAFETLVQGDGYVDVFDWIQSQFWGGSVVAGDEGDSIISQCTLDGYSDLEDCIQNNFGYGTFEYIDYPTCGLVTSRYLSFPVIPLLAVGNGGTISIQGKFNGATFSSGDVLRNTGRVESDTFDYRLSNNQASIPTLYTNIPSNVVTGGGCVGVCCAGGCGGGGGGVSLSGKTIPEESGSFLSAPLQQGKEDKRECYYDDEPYATIDFIDIKRHLAEKEIETLRKMCVVRGRKGVYPKRAYEPDAEITNAEGIKIITKMLMMGKGYKIAGESKKFMGKTYFADSTQAQRHSWYTSKAKEVGLMNVSGMVSEDTIKPQDFMSTKIVQQMMGISFAIHGRSIDSTKIREININSPYISRADFSKIIVDSFGVESMGLKEFLRYVKNNKFLQLMLDVMKNTKYEGNENVLEFLTSRVEQLSEELILDTYKLKKSDVLNQLKTWNDFTK